MHPSPGRGRILVAVAAALAVSLGGVARAAPVSLPRTEVRTLRGANGISYRLDVSLPRSPAPAGRTRPVVVVLDSDYAFPVVRAVVEHLAERGWIDEVVVIGVGYDGETTRETYRTNRTRDYTPLPHPTGGYGPAYQVVSGGGPAFVRVLVEQVLPLAARDYGATGPRVLVGHSYGGLLACWTMVERPGAFDAFVAVSPSLWYADRHVLARTRAALEARKDLPVAAYLAVGSREGNAERDMQEDLRAFHALLVSRSLPGLRTRLDVLPDETHDSVFPGAVSNGLRFVLPGPRPP
ncbi:MAG TPA: alpha/beta hydrolase-fold protein [Anaeromyxobacteraceae bacterium]|nr:alpha/beta hydrolase-fold protein [Anaeromyxobacteraceae bacterium]